MPARVMFFTFDKDVKVNKKTVLEFVEEYKYYIDENFQDIKKEFEVDSINTDFLKAFIKELKGFDCVSIERGDVHGKQKIIKDFIYDLVGDEEREGDGLLKVRYLYDEWDYEGCGREDHYYLTYTDDKKMIKKTLKETEKQVEKLRNLGVKAELVISE
jgi:hypothetical protein